MSKKVKGLHCWYCPRGFEISLLRQQIDNEVQVFWWTDVNHELEGPRGRCTPELIAREQPQDRRSFHFKLCWQDPHIFF